MKILSIMLISVIGCVLSYKIITYKGTVNGKKVKDPEFGDFITFFGIPYAMVDEQNPFGASIETPPYNSTFEANDSTIICPQVGSDLQVIGEIQCLRLNIYVPKMATLVEPVPVLIWFRGENKDTEYDGKYLVKHDIIVVVANYRLGPYGFLCLDDPAVAGNQGLKDQDAAIRWVSQNIPNFGGDRDNITIAGQGVLGDLHLYSKQLKMFDKVIVHSGSAFAEDMYSQGDKAAAVKIAKYLGHNITSTRFAINTLAKMHPGDVIKATADLNLKLGPCIEKKFRHSANFVLKDAFHLGDDIINKIPTTKIMVGYTSNEEPKTFTEKDIEKLQDIFYEKLAKNYNLSQTELRKLAKIVQTFYLGNKKIGNKAISEISNFLSDFSINHAMEISISKYIKLGSPAVYKWLFSYTEGDSSINITSIGARKSDEIKYLFGFKHQNVTGEQRMMIKKMTLMWANFVKYGNPTPPDRDKSLLPVTWVSMTEDPQGRPCMNITSTLKLEYQIYHDKIAFWDLFVYNYSKYSKLAN